METRGRPGARGTSIYRPKTKTLIWTTATRQACCTSSIYFFNFFFRASDPLAPAVQSARGMWCFWGHPR